VALNDGLHRVDVAMLTLELRLAARVQLRQRIELLAFTSALGASR
jgi:hypothetical protein